MGSLLDYSRWITEVFARLHAANGELRPWVPTSRDRARLRVITIALGLQVVFRRVAKRDLPIPRLAFVDDNGRSLLRVQSDTELLGAVEVFSEQAYDLPGDSQQVRRILDLGANVGFASRRFSAAFPDAEIVAIEPAPDTYARLLANVADLPKVRTFQLAIGDPGTMRIDLSEPSTSRADDLSGGAKVERISLSQLLDLLKWETVDLVKLDIEGGEYMVFADRTGIARVGCIVGELHGAVEPDDFPGLDVLLSDFKVEQAPAGPHAGDWVFIATR